MLVQELRDRVEFGGEEVGIFVQAGSLPDGHRWSAQRICAAQGLVSACSRIEVGVDQQQRMRRVCLQPEERRTRPSTTSH